MKTIFKPTVIYIAFAMILAGCAGSYIVSQGVETGPVTYQTFYDDLSPYGTWIDYPGYGSVWNPGIDGDFRPYDTNGYWVYSDLGWAWQSGYSWGWAPFHYGRWLYDDMYGWLWVPGYNWAPAWVTWGFYGDDYCWAPLMPGVNVGQDFGYWRPPSFYWNACSRDHIYDRNLDAVTERPGQIANFTNRIDIIRNFTPTRRHDAFYSKGPDVQEVQRYVHTRVEPATIRDVHNMVEAKHNGNELNIYRPEVESPQTTTQRYHVQNIMPPTYRRADGANVRPFVRENQLKPEMQRSNQRDNINRLPEFHTGNTFHSNNEGRKPGDNK